MLARKDRMVGFGIGRWRSQRHCHRHRHSNAPWNFDSSRWTVYVVGCSEEPPYITSMTMYCLRKNQMAVTVRVLAAAVDA